MYTYIDPHCKVYSYYFFFSSRRRHTRCSRDWSSDVCSSDLKPRLQILDGRFVKLFPAVRVDRRVGHHHRIHDGVLSRELRGELQRISRNARRQKRQTVFVSDLHIHGEKTGPREKHAHVTVQMCRPDSRRHRAFHLRANLALRLVRFDILRRGRRFRPESARRIEKAWHFILRFHRSPAVDLPFACQREVQTQIRTGMASGVGRNFIQPGTRHHHACGSHRVFVQGVKTCGIHRMCNREIVRVHNQKFRIRWIAQALRHRFGLCAPKGARDQQESCNRRGSTHVHETLPCRAHRSKVSRGGTRTVRESSEATRTCAIRRFPPVV